MTAVVTSIYSIIVPAEGTSVNIDTILNSKIPIQPKPENGEQGSPRKTASPSLPQGMFYTNIFTLEYLGCLTLLVGYCKNLFINKVKSWIVVI